MLGSAITRVKFAKWQLENQLQVSLHDTPLWRTVLQRKLRSRIRRTDVPLRVVLGGGPHFAEPGWCLTERHILDVVDEASWQRLFGDRQVDALIAEHVWEHLTWDEGVKAAANACRWLRPGGTFRVSVPDGCHPDPEYIEDVRPGGIGAAALEHQVLFTSESLRRLLESAGLEVRLLEYWDAHGVFHHEPWSAEGGAVKRRPDVPVDAPTFTRDRSYASYPVRRQASPWDAPRAHRFTSLIADARRPGQARN